MTSIEFETAAGVKELKKEEHLLIKDLLFIRLLEWIQVALLREAVRTMGLVLRNELLTYHDTNSP